MSKAVLISIQPKWCELIFRGKKTIEIRKTKPKLDVPFKCYIYQSKGRGKLIEVLKDGDKNYGEIYHGKPVFIKSWGSSAYFGLCGMEQKVIGEFVCDWITGVKCDNAAQAAYNRKHDTCLSDEEIMKYANNGKVYYWHISDLVIYDKPKELCEFCCIDSHAIKKCKNRFRMGQPEYCTKHGGWIKGSYGCLKDGEPEWCENCITKPLKRPPQSWCYVEEREDNGST